MHRKRNRITPYSFTELLVAIRNVGDEGLQTFLSLGEVASLQVQSEDVLGGENLGF